MHHTKHDGPDMAKKHIKTGPDWTQIIASDETGGEADEAQRWQNGFGFMVSSW